MSANQLVVNAIDDVGHREPTLLLGDRRMELDLIHQVTEFFDQGGVGREVVGIECV